MVLQPPSVLWQKRTTTNLQVIFEDGLQEQRASKWCRAFQFKMSLIPHDALLDNCLDDREMNGNALACENSRCFQIIYMALATTAGAASSRPA